MPYSVGVNFVDVTTSALPGGYVGIDYSTFLQATGGDGSYTWSKTAGDWPDGISLIPSTGEIRGRPTLSGDYDLTVRVTSNGLTSDKMPHAKHPVFRWWSYDRYTLVTSESSVKIIHR